MAAEGPLEVESFLGTVPGMIYRTRLAPPPYSIEFVSDEMTAIAGYPASDFMGPTPRRVWGELVDPDDRERSRAALMAAPADGAITEVEYRVRRAPACAGSRTGLRRSADRSSWRARPAAGRPYAPACRSARRQRGQSPSTSAHEAAELGVEAVGRLHVDHVADARDHDPATCGRSRPSPRITPARQPA